MSRLIYAADDEQNIRNLLQLFLEDAGYEVKTFENGDDLWRCFCECPSDLVILDVMMPGDDGMEICRRLRSQFSVPIIMLTAKDTENDYVLGMTIGSDDYIVKPFRPTTLLMKIKAIFRRIELEHERDLIPQNKELQYVIGDLRISEYERRIYLNNHEIPVQMDFSRTEFDLFVYLVQHVNKAISREEMLNEVWGIDVDLETRIVDETIRKVRKKLAQISSQVQIQTVWGHGYRIVEVR